MTVPKYLSAKKKKGGYFPYMWFTDVLLELVDFQLSNMWLDSEFSTSIYQIFFLDFFWGGGRGDFRAMNISLVCLSLISSSSYFLAKTNSFIKMLHLYYVTCCGTKLIYECLFWISVWWIIVFVLRIYEWACFSYWVNIWMGLFSNSRGTTVPNITLSNSRDTY